MKKFAKDPKATSKLDDDVERVRRAHLNDLENIPVFFTIAFFYMLTDPSEYIAINLFRVAAIGRICYTISYVFLQMQPHRAISWFACYAVTVYMGLSVMCAFL